jgi:hypothetical protein
MPCKLVLLFFVCSLFIGMTHDRFKKVNSISVYCNPIASKQNIEALSVLNFFSFIAGVVDTCNTDIHKIL